MYKLSYLLILFLIPTFAFSQNYVEEEIIIETPHANIHGTLLQPKIANSPLVIIIPGSGPTDRDGNNLMSKNNSLKFLAEALVKHNIASYRYDKSVLHLNSIDTSTVKNLRFQHFITEAKTAIQHFKAQKKYTKIIVAGHSQGSLVGLIASKNNADAFISLAGAGRTIDNVLIEQIEKNSPMFKGEVERVLGELKKGNLVADYNPLLESLFNSNIQPFLISWIAYNPQVEIAKLNIPILLINGTKDIQINTSEAELLQQNSKNSELHFIENMNHVLKIIEGDLMENIASYSNPDLKVSEELIEIIINFVKN